MVIQKNLLFTTEGEHNTQFKDINRITSIKQYINI